MKNLIFFLLGVIVSISVNAQIMMNLEEVGLLSEGLLAVKKNGQWAFVDHKGAIVIDFRDDLVEVENVLNKKKYPVFHEGRCLIRREKEGLIYYGYIDPAGIIVIEPQYVNATPFKGGFAVVMNYIKEVVGKNKLLGKDVVSYRIEEFVIDADGKTMTPMLNSRNYVPDKMKSKKAPDFTSKLLGDRMIGVYTEDNNWELHSF
ncbi:WG repeat-containing protein [Lutimonas saemankumensis]|uniref:WG repeat-containing protein n=1 Tax=Lutimonas saemankumensis TaxID=483016 RepID=UPI001CD436BF|nr:WG repeat-containing protein [Lutimonas saemankumensis]MCA0932185.1 WG repeat-containing protein [Lutimonas saemankumensis]